MNHYTVRLSTFLLVPCLIVGPAATARAGRDEHVNLLIHSNRDDEALQEYQKTHPSPRPGKAVDFKLLEMLLKTGHYNNVLRATAAAPGSGRDFLRDMKILELRVQALLAKGQYAESRRGVEDWLASYAKEGLPGTRFESDVRSLQSLVQHLATIEHQQGSSGKSLFAPTVSDSSQHWSKRQNVPIYFYKLLPARTAGQFPATVQPGQQEGDDYFADRVADLNQGFDYVSGGQFSLRFAGQHTLFVQNGDLSPISSGAHLLTSTVYVHTIPQVYKLAGTAYVVLLDYRFPGESEAVYLGDGLIHLSGSKFKTLVLMHEILHALGATHQDFAFLERQGCRANRDDRGLMTFNHGEILDLGIETKNRAVLGWPAVAVVRPHFISDDSMDQDFHEPSFYTLDPGPPQTAFQPGAAAPNAPELIPVL